MKKVLIMLCLMGVCQLSLASGLSVVLNVLGGHQNSMIAIHTDPDPPCPAGKKCDPSWNKSVCPAPTGGAIFCGGGETCCPTPFESTGYHNCFATAETVTDCCSDGFHYCTGGKLCQYDAQNHYVGCADPALLNKK